MDPKTTGSITHLLFLWNSGDKSCLEELVVLLDRELRAIARAKMRRERQGHTLQTSALINEAYLKLVDHSRATWRDRAQFLCVAAGLMRRILIDHARSHCRNKRRGAALHLPLDEQFVFSPSKSASLIALDDALSHLAKLDPRKAQIVEMRYFGGLSVGETAEALDVHPRTVVRDWALARAWLKIAISREAENAT